MKKLRDVWDDLPDIEHTHKYIDNKTGLRMYQICGKKFQETVRIDYIIPVLEKHINEYGKRAKLAKENNFCDWKAMSHALGYGYQIKELFKTGDIKFPLKQRKYSTKVKESAINYKKVATALEELMDTIEKLSQETNLPSKFNRKFWIQVVLNIHRDIILY